MVNTDRRTEISKNYLQVRQFLLQKSFISIEFVKRLFSYFALEIRLLSSFKRRLKLPYSVK